MAKLIQQVTKGDPDTLLVTDRANELIDKLNALLNMQVQPAESGNFVVGDGGNAILTISGGGGSVPADINQAISDFVDTYLTLDITCNTDGTITATIVNSYGT